MRLFLFIITGHVRIIEPFFRQLPVPAMQLELVHQDPFDLAVGASELVRSPFFNSLIDILIDPQHKFLLHDSRLAQD